MKDKIIWRVLFPSFFIVLWILALGANIGWFDLKSIYLANNDTLFFDISVYVYVMMTIIKWFILIGALPLAISGFCGMFENPKDEKPQEKNGQDNFYD
jgi:hypothetical protein